MTRIKIPTRDEAPTESQPILDGLKNMIGMVPNVISVLSISPNVLTGFTGLQRSLGGSLTLRTRDQIALAVSQVNNCSYCLAAHEFFSGFGSKLTQQEIQAARKGETADAKEGAAVRFAKKVVETRGKVGQADIDAVKGAGYTDAQVLEIVALSVQFLFTNFVNNVFDTTPDAAFAK